MSIYKLDDEKYIIAGRLIGFFNINDFSYKILYDDSIDKRTIGYLTGTDTDINYSNFVLTYFNKLICRRKFLEISRVSYEGIDDSVSANERSFCIFDYNPKNNTIQLNKNYKKLYIGTIYKNNDEEIIVSIGGDKIRIYYID